MAIFFPVSAPSADPARCINRVRDSVPTSSLSTLSTNRCAFPPEPSFQTRHSSSVYLIKEELAVEGTDTGTAGALSTVRALGTGAGTAAGIGAGKVGAGRLGAAAGTALV